MKLKLLFLIDHLQTGGAQEFLLQLCASLPREQLELSVCTLREGELYRKRLEGLGIPVVALAPSGEPWRRPSVIARLWQLLGTGRYDLVHTILEGSFAIGTPLARLMGAGSLHSLMALRRQTPTWYFPLMRAYQPLVDAYCTFLPSELRAAGVVEAKISPVEVVIDTAPLVQLQRIPTGSLPEIDLPTDALLAVSIARLFPDKGHDLAIKAWPQVLERVPNARLLIVGDGEEEPRLRALIQRLGLEQAVCMPGFRSDLSAILERAAICLRSSKNEGVNLITIQAMAAGLPVVGFANGAPKEIVVHGRNGLLAPAGDVRAFADAIVLLATQPALRHCFGANGRAGVRDYYDSSAVIAHYAHLYRLLAEQVPQQQLPSMLDRPWPFAGTARH
jgi:glycosyltransferase involved in cell wall biosynthesis